LNLFRRPTELLTGLDQAQTLAVVFPATMAARHEEKGGKLLQHVVRGWGIATGAEEERIDAAIAHTCEFFKSLGV
jgi:NADP-dependent alcohol dehydrogenase